MTTQMPSITASTLACPTAMLYRVANIERGRSANVLAARAREVIANPKAFSLYTIKFAKSLRKHWTKLYETAPESTFRVPDDRILMGLE
jgi:hypothetical protein